MLKKSLLLVILLISAFFILGATFSSRPSTPAVERNSDPSKLSDRGPAGKVASPVAKNQDECIGLEVTISPDTVTAGDPVTLTVVLTNNCEDTKTIDVVYNIFKGSLNIMRGKISMTLEAGEEASDTITRTISPITPKGGEYTLKTAAYVDGVKVAEDEDYLTVY